jgi:hypothetical protein
MHSRSIAVVFAAAVLAGACAESTVSTDPGPAAGGGGGRTAVDPTEPETVTGAQPVPEILDFEAQLVGGGTIRGAELAGAPVAVWFWAPW